VTDRVRVASIGLGWWGKELARAAAATGEIEIVNCFARTPEKREEFAAAFDCDTADSLDDLLADDRVEGVLIATSHTTHREIVEAAAEAGKHIFVEKPLTVTYDDGLAAVEAAEKAGVVLQVGHQRRRLSAHRAMRRMLDEGEIGDLQMLEANHSLPNGFNLPPEAWRWDAGQSPLGSMTSLAVHQVDNFLYLGGPIGRVAALTRKGRSVPIDEATGLLIEFESGAVGTILTSFFTPWHIRLAIHGTEGAAFTVDDGAVLEYQPRGERERQIRGVDSIDPVADQLTEFARVVRDSGQPEVGGRDGLAVVAVLEAAIEAAETGRFVDVRGV
jgi:predicted dehydrogenase